MEEVGKINTEIKILIDNAKRNENENKIEAAIQNYKEIIVKTSKLINLQPNMKTKYLNDIAFFSLKMLKIEQIFIHNNISKTENQVIEDLSKRLLNETKTLAENAKNNNTTEQESYENYIKASNKLIALMEIDSNPNYIKIYKEKAQEYKNEGVKLRKIYNLKKIDEDFEEDNKIELNEEIKVKEQLISDLFDKISKINKENESLKNDSTLQNSTISELEDKMSSLENKNKLLEKEKNNYKELMNEKVKECKALKQLSEEHKNNYEHLKIDYDKLNKNYNELNRNYINIRDLYQKKGKKGDLKEN
jgi:hypothetical protein